MKKRNIAEQMFNDVMDTIRESQIDLENAVSKYTSSVPTGPLTDIIEGNKEIVVKIDLPGVIKDNVKIDINEENLEIKASFVDETILEGSNYIKRERKRGEVKRVVRLPAKIKIDEATADFENGVLTVTLPKVEQKESYKVNVE